MPEQPLPAPSEERPVQARLTELAEFLRRADTLTPEARRTLADLVAELSQDLKPDTLSAVERTHLADTISQLTRALQERRPPGALASARQRLERAAARAEAEAPLAATFLGRLLDAISNLGI
jgi:hypothetical protein